MTNDTSETQACQGFQQHPLSAAFPPMEPDDYQALVLDIQANGLQNSILLYDGMILDGWHRYEACLSLHVEPSFVELPEDAAPHALVLGLNIARRHLTPSQKSAAVVACNEWAPVGFNQHSGGGEATSHPLTNSDMAKYAGVSIRTIQQAKKALSAGLGRQVSNGKITVEKAAEIAKLPARDRQAAVNAPKVPRAPKAPKVELPADVKALQARVKELESIVASHVGEINELVETLRDVVAENEALTAKVKLLEEAPRTFNDALMAVEQARKEKDITRKRLDSTIVELATTVREVKKWKDRCAKLEAGKPVADLECLPPPSNLQVSPRNDSGPVDDDFPMEECGAPSPSWMNGEAS